MQKRKLLILMEEIQPVVMVKVKNMFGYRRQIVQIALFASVELSKFRTIGAKVAVKT